MNNRNFYLIGFSFKRLEIKLFAEISSSGNFRYNDLGYSLAVLLFITSIIFDYLFLMFYKKSYEFLYPLELV